MINLPQKYRKTAALSAAPGLTTVIITLLFALLLPAVAARADDEPSASERFERWNTEYGDSDRLYGARIKKLADYIEENFAVEEDQAFSIVSTAVEHGNRQGINPELLLAVIAVESTFKHDAVSSQGARGLMQILPRAHPGTIREIGGAHALFEPENNIKVGTQILVSYLNASQGDMHRALARYNGSLGSKKRALAYSSKVMRIYRQLQGVS